MNTEILIKSLKLLAVITLGSVLTFYLAPFSGPMLNYLGSTFWRTVGIMVLTFFFAFFLMSLGFLSQRISGFDDRYPIPFISSIVYLYFLGVLIGGSFLAPLSFIVSIFDNAEGFEKIANVFFLITLPLCILLVSALVHKGYEFAFKNKKSNR